MRTFALTLALPLLTATSLYAADAPKHVSLNTSDSNGGRRRPTCPRGPS